MKFLFVSLKGGVGKTAISINFATYRNCTYVTNDISSPDHPQIERIKTNKKRIPHHLTQLDDIVFDFGAMSTKIDSKVTQALKLADVIVIPTKPDPRSVKATIETYQFVKAANKPVAIIINNFRNEKLYDKAETELTSNCGQIPIFKIRETTLFDRVVNDGIEWYKNIGHKHGDYQLNKTRLKHEAIYDQVIELGEK